MKTTIQDDISIGLLRIIKKYCKVKSVSYPNKRVLNAVSDKRLSLNQILGVSLEIEEKFQVLIFEELLQVSNPNDLLEVCSNLISKEPKKTDFLQNREIN